MLKLKDSRSLHDILKGAFSLPIPYEVRVLDSNWSPFFGHYQNQKWGHYDSNSCWCLSAVNCQEDQLEWIWKNNMFSEEAKNFFTQNGYIDSDGDFSISERFLEILSGCKDNGGSQETAWNLMETYGCIPRDLLTYTQAEANSFLTREAFVADYFNPRAISSQMKALARQFLTYVDIAHQKIGTRWETPDMQTVKAALMQAPLHIGVPVPNMVWQWNNPIVQYDGKQTADHAVELYGIDSQNRYLIFDQYQPNLKVLSADYYLPIVTQGVVKAHVKPAVKPVSNPVPQNSLWNLIWTAINEWFNRPAVRRA